MSKFDAFLTTLVPDTKVCCKSNDGAVAAADAYSLVETAKANGLDVLKYLNYVFRRIPMADGNLTDDFLESLMPWNEAVRAECQRGYI